MCGDGDRVRSMAMGDRISWSKENGGAGGGTDRVVAAMSAGC